MSEHHLKAGKVDEAEEVFDVIFPAGDESSEGVHPGEEPLDFPAAAIASQRSSILGLAFTVGAAGRDQLDSVRCWQVSSRADPNRRPCRR